MRFSKIIMVLPLLALAGCGKSAIPLSNAPVEFSEDKAMQKACADIFAGGYQVSDIRDLTGKLSKLKILKDDFETSEAYQQRLQSDLQKIGVSADKNYFFPVKLEPRFVSYDADRQWLTVQRFAISNKVTPQHRALFGTDSALHKGGIGIGYGSTSHNIDLPLEETERVTGSYLGQNAFGLTQKVSITHWTQYGIFDRQGTYNYINDVTYDENLFGYDDNAFSLSLAPELARTVKNAGRVIVAVQPYYPYYAEGEEHLTPITDNPIDLTRHYKYLLGDIKCAALVVGGDVIAVTRTQ